MLLPEKGSGLRWFKAAPKADLVVDARAPVRITQVTTKDKSLEASVVV
jgi:hypothetical protein